MSEYCTFYDTGTNYRQQLTGQCFDCFKDPNHALCINCLNKCHKDHHITNIKFSNAFCDCKDSGKCFCVKNKEDTKNE